MFRSCGQSAGLYIVARFVKNNSQNLNDIWYNLIFWFLKTAINLRFNRYFATAEPVEKKTHSIIRDTEKPIGDLDKHEFQAETRMLLDIVARSLYSDKVINKCFRLDIKTTAPNINKIPGKIKFRKCLCES